MIQDEAAEANRRQVAMTMDLTGGLVAFAEDVYRWTADGPLNLDTEDRAKLRKLIDEAIEADRRMRNAVLSPLRQERR